MIYYLGYAEKDYSGKLVFKTTYAQNLADTYKFAKAILKQARIPGSTIVDNDVVVGKCHRTSIGYIPDEIIEVLCDRELTEEEKQTKNVREYHPQ